MMTSTLSDTPATSVAPEVAGAELEPPASTDPAPAAGTDQPPAAITATPAPEVGTEATANPAVLAEDAYRASLAAGNPLTGRELGRQHGRSERWGRDRIAAVRASGTGPTRPKARSGRAAGRKPAAAAAPSGTAVERTAAAAAAPPVLELERQPARVETEAAAVSRPVAETAAVGPAGGRLVAWVGFVFGSVMSVAANVLSTWLPAASMPAGWSPGLAPQIGAAVWPISLLLAVEVLSRVRWRTGPGWILARYGGAGIVALGSALISYGHLREVLVAWGYRPLAAGVGPLVLDGLMVISGFALLAMSSTKPTTNGKEPPA